MTKEEKRREYNRTYRKANPHDEVAAKAYRDAAKLTPEGMSSFIYSAMKANAKRRKMAAPNFTLKELRLWMYRQPNFLQLFNAWTNSGHKTELRPSCDRINNDVSYKFSNLELVTWKINRKRGFEDKAKVVLQICKDTYEVIKMWPSAQQVHRELGFNATNINSCSRGLTRSAYGFIWAREDSKRYKI